MGRHGRGKVKVAFQVTDNSAKLADLFAKTNDIAVTSGNVVGARMKRQICQQVRRIWVRFDIGKGLNWQAKARGGADSAIHEFAAHGVDGNTRRFGLKYYRPPISSNTEAMQEARELAADDFRALQLLQLFFAHEDELGVPTAYHLFADEAAVLMAHVDGVRLDHRLRFARWRHGTAEKTLLRVQIENCGAWLGHLHSATASAGEAVTVMKRFTDEVRDYAAKCRDLEVDRTVASEIVSVGESIVSDLSRQSNAIVASHCDYAAWNILVSGPRICVLDFEGYRPGLAYEDICYFLCQLATLPRYHLSHNGAGELQASFLEGYSQHRQLDDALIQGFMLLEMAKVMATSRLLNDRPKSQLRKRQRAARLRFHRRWFRRHLETMT